jgi:16S rRNA (cytidine1402-2'-O)-methyltransferase
MSGTLFVVATPIGNLEDVTLRAIRVLRTVAVIAAEDTRHTAKLLAHYGVETPTVSFHEHNTRSRVPQLLARLERGDDVALVSDAGTPSVSDPGLELVQACIRHGVTIDVVPGPSAPLTALVASGFPTSPVTMFDFAPARAKDRGGFLQTVQEIPHTVVFFEAPHRIRDLLQEAAAILVDRPIIVARELTKVHQEVIRGSFPEILEALTTPRGELTVVVGPRPREASVAARLPEGARLSDEFCHLTETEGLSRRQAISRLAKSYQRPAREVYAALEAGKCLVE